MLARYFQTIFAVPSRIATGVIWVFDKNKRWSDTGRWNDTARWQD